ncbi:MAG: c-type cytochrome biogenesis protein CcmI [Pseudorhodobacter sp.]
MAVDWLFLVLAVAMVLAVAAILIAALRRGGGNPAVDHDIQVYRDQLREIERDARRGTVSQEESTRLRAEVARRLLEADRREAARLGADGVSTVPTGWPVIAALVVVLAAGGWIYGRIGAPGYADLPLQLRLELAEERRANRPDQARLEASLPPAPAVTGQDPEYLALVEQLRQTVADRPDEAQGLIFLAQHEANLGNFDAAWRAQERLVALRGAAATGEERLLQATLMIQAARGQVSPEAEEVIGSVLSDAPDNDTALFLAGILNMQVGRHDLAFRLWRQLLQVAPDGRWAEEVRAGIGELAQMAGVRYAPSPAMAPVSPGPGAEDIEAAAEMTPEERAEMIRGMVEGLNDRLATQGGTAGEWARLIAALGQLGETERAAAIWAEAQENFSGREAELALLREAAERAGVVQ